MQVFGVIGPESGGLVDRIAEHTADIAVVRRRNVDGEGTDGRSAGGEGASLARELESEPAGHTAVVGATTYTLSGDGWSATGDELTLAEALDRLAPDHDLAVVEGFPEADLPQVVVGAEADNGGEVLSVAPDPEEVRLENLLGRVADLDHHETLESLVSEVKRSPGADRAGAIATFTGRVRQKDAPTDPPTEYLEFEKHEGVADRRMRAIEDELEAREGVYEVAMHHRTGIVPAGDDIVFVVVLAGHRREAFRTVEDGIDRLKQEVPLFKKEVTSDETFWVHERE